jgi:hypothetical protein
MIKLEYSVVINRPVEKVFDFMTDPKNDTQWVEQNMGSELTSEGPMVVGSNIKRVNRLWGRTIESTSEVTAYEINRVQAEKSTSGPIPFEISNIFEAVEGDTRVTASGQLDAGGFFKLAEGIVARRIQKQQEANFAKLKEVLEIQD